MVKQVLMVKLSSFLPTMSFTTKPYLHCYFLALVVLPTLLNPQPTIIKKLDIINHISIESKFLKTHAQLIIIQRALHYVPLFVQNTQSP